MRAADSARARLLAFAARVAAVLNVPNAEPVAGVVRLTSGYRRGYEWRASARTVGDPLANRFGETAATGYDLRSVYAHGPTPEAAVEAAINEWRREIDQRRRDAEEGARAYAARAEVWGKAITALRGGA